MPTPHALIPGDELAGFRLENELGRGGMSVVYVATQLSLQRRVALKLMDPELAADREYRDRFIRESHAAAMLDDPNILPVYDAGEAGGHLYIAMRHVDGTDLGRLLREQGALAPQYVLSLVEQIAGALDTAHQAGLVHRDVKPGNILIDRRGLAFLCDFGLATRMRSAEEGDGTFMGTLDYCAPEQIRGRPADGRADTYSLAAVAFHALTGSPPFARDTDRATIEAHLHEPPPSLRARRPDLPAELSRVLAEALAKSPAPRPPTPLDFAEAFGAALRGETAEPEPEPPAAADGGRLTDELLRAKLEQGRGRVGKQDLALDRDYTRKHEHSEEDGRLTDGVLADRLEQGRGRVGKQDLALDRDYTRKHEHSEEDGRLTDDVLRAKLESQRRRRRP